MSNVSQNRMIVGLDIGTSKVVAIVGEVSPEGKLEIVGIGSHGSKGLKKRRGGQHRLNGAIHPKSR